MPSYLKSATQHKSQVRLADTTVVFRMRCWAKAHLVACGDCDFIDAVDALQAAAIASGLVQRLGQDQVQAIIHSEFEKTSHCAEIADARCAPAAVAAPIESNTPADPADDYAAVTHSFMRLCRAADAARGDVPTPAPCRLVATHGVPSTATMQAEYLRRIARQRAKYGPAESTLKTAEYLIGLRDLTRWRVWLAERNATERAAILQHLERKRAK